MTLNLRECATIAIPSLLCLFLAMLGVILTLKNAGIAIVAKIPRRKGQSIKPWFSIWLTSVTMNNFLVKYPISIFQIEESRVSAFVFLVWWGKPTSGRALDTTLNSLHESGT